MPLSARNQIPARVTSINSGEAIANVELDTGGVRLGGVDHGGSGGATRPGRRLTVTAVIKASDVILATD